MRLVQSFSYKQTMHAMRDKSSTHALCGYPIGRSWKDWGTKWLQAPSYPRVSCKHCRRVLGVLTPPTQRLARAVQQLGELVALGMETRTLPILGAQTQDPGDHP